MAHVSEILSTDVRVVEPQHTLRSAAQLMRTINAGSVPVCSGQRLLGMLTERDITARAVAQGAGHRAALRV